MFENGFLGSRVFDFYESLLYGFLVFTLFCLLTNLIFQIMPMNAAIESDFEAERCKVVYFCRFVSITFFKGLPSRLQHDSAKGNPFETAIT